MRGDILGLMNGTGRMLPTSLVFPPKADEIFVCGQNDNDAILIWFLTQIESCRRSVHSNFSLLSRPPGHIERESPCCSLSEDHTDVTPHRIREIPDSRMIRRSQEGGGDLQRDVGPARGQ